MPRPVQGPFLKAEPGGLSALEAPQALRGRPSRRGAEAFVRRGAARRAPVAAVAVAAGRRRTARLGVMPELARAIAVRGGLERGKADEASKEPIQRPLNPLPGARKAFRGREGEEIGRGGG
ncbi:hypothetical protein R5R35_001633 [Gryllus longicercus]|uniref:Uncharacterized protein n=1 Tax=Gryllus longicercus TaxID=2509291 RepID=A0AAN9VMF6_9ORTH